MGDIFEDPLAPHSIEHLRRTLAFGDPSEPATIDRQRALALLAELARLRHEHAETVTQLQVLLGRLESRRRAGGPT